jgi:hypothetical protein
MTLFVVSIAEIAATAKQVPETSRTLAPLKHPLAKLKKLINFRLT